MSLLFRAEEALTCEGIPQCELSGSEAMIKHLAVWQI